MSDLDDLLGELQEGSSVDFQTELDLNNDLEGLMKDLNLDIGTPPQSPGKSRPVNTRPVGKNTMAELDELDSLVADLAADGLVVEDTHDSDFDSLIDNLAPPEQSFDSALDALMGDLGGIGEPEPLPRGHHSNKTSHKYTPPSEPAINEDELEDLLSDLTSTSKSAVRGGGGASRATPAAASSSKGNFHHTVSGTSPSTGRTVSTSQPQTSGRSQSRAMQVGDPDELDDLMNELTDPTNSRVSNIQHQHQHHSPNQRGVSTSQRTNTPSRATPNSSGRGASHMMMGGNTGGIDELDSLMNQLALNQPPSRSVSTAKPAAAQQPQRQPTQQQQQQHHRPIPEEDIDSLMNELVPQRNTRPVSTQVSQPRANQPPQPPQQQHNGPSVAELDELMANLGGTSRTSNLPQRGVSRASTAPTSTDLDEMLNSLQSPTDPRVSMFSPPEPRPSMGGGYGVNESRSNVRMDTRSSVSPYNTHSSTPNRNASPSLSSRAPNRSGTGTRDLTEIMEGLNNPLDGVSGVNTQAQIKRAPEPKLPKGVCSGCRKYISSNQKIQAMGREYHPEHFQCSTCNRPIGNNNFYEREGQPQCEKCYQAVFCQKCANCALPITTQCVTALSQNWHPECFACAKCAIPFHNSSFFEKQGKPYCNNCINDTFSQKCKGCNQPIHGSVINALGSMWHPEHFNCQTCHRAFPNNSFYELNGLPYCESHYNQLIYRGM